MVLASVLSAKYGRRHGKRRFHGARVEVHKFAILVEWAALDRETDWRGWLARSHLRCSAAASRLVEAKFVPQSFFFCESNP